MNPIHDSHDSHDPHDTLGALAPVSSGPPVRTLHGELVRSGLTVSCQAYPGEAMRDPRTMSQVARACVSGGAQAIRAQGLDDLTAIRACVDVPLIGLVKAGDDPVFITPTLGHARAVARTGADVVAVDGTRRPRPDGRSLGEVIGAIHDEFPGVLVMADCGSLPDALAAEQAGADILGTTLAGYTGERPRTEGPDLDLVRDVVAAVRRPVVVEGRVHTPAHAAEALALGAHSVCVGTAITHPSTITSWFAHALRIEQQEP
ncbi:N-acetylmannosamine-6-phosphate 2-epimerase [Kineococcus sp. SYSU DK002]|uniref:N-acetylmannosamine-6-phosphate 2-epimerase n=1 Tax=Kineococcus sp. SYSU DK002 TaxID=3383123 RepID=UPI003D7C87F6